MNIPILPCEKILFIRRGDLVYSLDGELLGYCIGVGKEMEITIHYTSLVFEGITRRLELREFAERHGLACSEEPRRKVVAESLRNLSVEYDSLAKRVEGDAGDIQGEFFGDYI